MWLGAKNSMEAMVDDETLQKVAEIFGSEEAVQIVNALKGANETTLRKLPIKQEFASTRSAKSFTGCTTALL